MKKEKPILFKTDMVQAIIAKKKVQTRRITEPLKYINKNPDDWELEDNNRFANKKTGELMYDLTYEEGQHLWVKETWHIERYENIDGGEGDRLETLAYRADGIDKPYWKPSLFMPKRYARLWLRVTAVKFQRIQDISDYDIRKEGVDILLSGNYTEEDRRQIRYAWIKLWDSINAKRGYPWKMNPWVSIIHFVMAEKKQ